MKRTWWTQGLPEWMLDRVSFHPNPSLDPEKQEEQSVSLLSFTSQSAAAERRRVVEFMQRVEDAKFLRGAHANPAMQALAAVSGGHVSNFNDNIMRDENDAIVAVRMEWSVWSEMCELIMINDQVHGDFDPDDNKKICLVQADEQGGYHPVARQGDWVVRGPDGPVNAGNNPTAALLAVATEVAKRERNNNRRRK